MDEALYEQLFVAESRHWWCGARRRIVASLLDRYLPRDPGRRLRVCELGCGGGQTLADLSRRYDVCGMDPARTAARFCARRGIPVEPGRLPDQVPFPAESFDAVLIMDVLEHVPDDAAAVAAAARCVAPNGLILATAPAGRYLYTIRDARHGHQRRYDRRSFGRLFRLPGFTVRRLSYFNCFLFPLACAFRLGPKPRVWLHEALDLTVPPRPINRILENLFASEAQWLTHTDLPIGLSVLCVAVRE